MKRQLPRLSAHIAIVLSLILITLLIVDAINPKMAFLNNTSTKWLLVVFCVTSIVNAFFVYVATRRGR